MIKESLKQLYKEILNCHGCDLYKGIKNKVCARGSTKPLVLFIGEAPGRDEDRIGKPFVGAAGKLLDMWIKQLGLSEKEYAITNVVRCFPHDERFRPVKPPREIVQKCFSFLEREIAILRPKLIVLLGATAFEAFYPGEKNKPWNSLFYNDKYGAMFLIKHPAYYLRRNEVPDLSRLKQVINSLKKEEGNE